jgi:signal peptidase I
MNYMPENQSEQTTSSQPIKKSSFFRSFFWTTVWVGAIMLLIVRVVAVQQVNVVGQSMEPNYHEGELLLINQLDKNLQRGQVVAAYENKDIAINATYFTRFDPQNKFFLKRVIGLPGEEIELIGSKVIIYNQEYPSGVVLSESYLAPSIVQQMNLLARYEPRTKIPEKSYYLMGDNRANSRDSREKGPFPDYSIFGTELLGYRVIDLPRLMRKPNNNSWKLAAKSE